MAWFEEWVPVISILVAALMVGNELTVAAFLHPTLYRLPAAAHASAARAFARLFGRVMPPWYALTLLLTLVNLWIQWGSKDDARQWLLASAALWAASIVYTLIFPFPLNNRITRWDLEALPSDWLDQRRRWDSYHRLRVAILLVALLCLVLGLLHSAT
jgi:uncharacterized membrane protein